MKKQVIFITGTSSGLGKAIAELCNENGHIVYGSSRNPPAENPSFKELKVDVTDQQSVQNAVNYVLEKEGRIDVVINNAGLGIIGPIEYLDVADVNRVWQTNVNGLLYVLQAVLPSMSSIASVIALPFRGVYCASKAAGDKIIQSLRMELSQTNISCCSIQAGDIRTSINENRLKVKDLEDPFYADIVKRTNQHIDEEVNKGMSANAVALEIYRLLSHDKLPISYVVGKPLQKLSLWIKRIVSESIFEKIIASYSK